MHMALDLHLKCNCIHPAKSNTKHHALPRKFLLIYLTHLYLPFKREL